MREKSNMAVWNDKDFLHAGDNLFNPFKSENKVRFM